MKSARIKGLFCSLLAVLLVGVTIFPCFAEAGTVSAVDEKAAPSVVFAGSSDDAMTRIEGEDMDRLPRVTRENVLILKYYSFENYFLDPKIMEKIGVIKSEDDFYEILLKKWNEYLYKLKSGQHLTEMIGHVLKNTTDIREHMEEIRICLRGHNLYDIFYGRFRKNETEILKSYIEEAPRDTFKDILDAIDRFVYFENRKK